MYKRQTNDTRESAAISICKDLIDEGAYLVIHDPKVSPKQIENDLEISPIPKSQKGLENTLKNKLGGNGPNKTKMNSDGFYIRPLGKGKDRKNDNEKGGGQGRKIRSAEKGKRKTEKGKGKGKTERERRNRKRSAKPATL